MLELFPESETAQRKEGVRDRSHKGFFVLHRLPISTSFALWYSKNLGLLYDRYPFLYMFRTAIFSLLSPVDRTLHIPAISICAFPLSCFPLKHHIHPFLKRFNHMSQPLQPSHSKIFFHVKCFTQFPRFLVSFDSSNSSFSYSFIHLPRPLHPNPSNCLQCHIYVIQIDL